MISQLPSGLFCFLQLPSPSDVSDGRYISFFTTSVAKIAEFLSFEIKFCFCDEASFDFSASEASFGFSASEASCGFAPFGVSISTNRVSNIFSCSCSLAISSQENLCLRESEPLMPSLPCRGTFPSFAWKNADSSTNP